jgi:CheY-like chemotaxis protein
LGHPQFRKTAAAFLATKIAEIDPWLSHVESQPPRPSHLPKLGEVLAALRRPWKAPAPPVAKPLGPVALVHLEDNQALREPVSALVGTLPGGHYSNTVAPAPTPAAHPVVAANLLNHEAFAALSEWLHTGPQTHEVFAYCADGSHGFALPPANLIAPPIDPRVCAEHIIKRHSGLQRLLVVSEDMEWVAVLRAALAKHGCAASAAFDTSQAIYLVSMIRPEAVLISLDLPDGEGVRLVMRWHTDEALRRLPLTVLLPSADAAAEFRQHALRAARELPLPPSELVRALSERLGEPVQADTPAANPA